MGIEAGYLETFVLVLPLLVRSVVHVIDFDDVIMSMRVTWVLVP